VRVFGIRGTGTLDTDRSKISGNGESFGLTDSSALPVMPVTRHFSRSTDDRARTVLHRAGDPRRTFHWLGPRIGETCRTRPF
jgi:hypothetical protein